MLLLNLFKYNIILKLNLAEIPSKKDNLINSKANNFKTR